MSSRNRRKFSNWMRADRGVALPPRTGELTPEDFERFRAVVESYLYVTQLIDHKSTTIARLRKLLFGVETEKTAAVTGREPTSGPQVEPAVTSEADSSSEAAKPKARTRPQRGRRLSRGQARERGSRVAPAGRSLPDAGGARFTNKPSRASCSALRVSRRCRSRSTNSKSSAAICAAGSSRRRPPEWETDKYDPTVASMIGLLKYGNGLPFNRLDGLQENLGIPLPASTQWDIVAEAYPQLRPAHEELIRQAAQGEVLFNDDTTVKILELMGERAKAAALAESGERKNDAASDPDRTGLFTSGVVATREGRRIALFFSGRKHAGENLQEVLRRRATDLPPPIQMCDALSRNRPGELQTIVANCLAHARRQFVDVHERFPAECRYVLEAFEVVYRNDQLRAKIV